MFWERGICRVALSRPRRKLRLKCAGGGDALQCRKIVSIGRVQDLPERNTAEDEGAEEAPEGEKSVEVMWLRSGGRGGG